MAKAAEEVLTRQEPEGTLEKVAYGDLNQLHPDLDGDYVILATENVKEDINLPFDTNKLAVIAVSTPYDTRYLPAVSYLAVYGAEYPNILAGMKAVFGLIEARGELPDAIQK